MNHVETSFDREFVSRARDILADPTINLVVGARETPEWAEAIDAARSPNLQIWLIGEETRGVRARIEAEAGALAPDPDAIRQLADDCQSLLDAFSAISDDPAPFLSLRVIDESYFSEGQASVSRHYHRDASCLTLYCSYTGRGTEWTPNSNVRREYFVNTQMQQPHVTDGEVVHDPDLVFRSGGGEIAILKGELRPDEPDASARAFLSHFYPLSSYPRFNVGHGLIHRGPPLGGGESRLVLTISSFRVPDWLQRTDANPVRGD